MDHQPQLPKKSLGQHWLNDQASLEAICSQAQLTSSDTVVEIGPGLGSLTSLLVARARRVVAVEYDERLAAELPGRILSSRLELHRQDILAFKFTTLPPDYKIVANIPYYLTSHLIRLISQTSNPPISATLLVQKEVAQRIAAGPGDMSLLSVTTQYYWQVELGLVIEAELFQPPPKVDSQIVHLERRTRPLFDVPPKSFFRLVKAGFSQRRKTLLNSLSSGLGIDKSKIEAICRDTNIDPDRRPQTLSLDEWHRLHKAL